MVDAYFFHNHYSLFPVAHTVKILQTIFCSFPPHKFVRWKLPGLERNIEAACACTNRWSEIIVITLMMAPPLPCCSIQINRSPSNHETITVIIEELQFDWLKPTWRALEVDACERIWHHILAYIYFTYVIFISHKAEKRDGRCSCIRDVCSSSMRSALMRDCRD